MKIEDTIGKSLGLTPLFIEFDLSLFITETIPGSFKGCSHSEESKKQISLKLKGKKLPPFSAEHKNNISISAKGKIPWNKGLNKQDLRVLKNANSRSKVRYSEETKNKFKKPKSEQGKINMSLGQIGKKYPKIACEVCGLFYPSNSLPSHMRKHKSEEQ